MSSEEVAVDEFKTVVSLSIFKDPGNVVCVALVM